MDALVSEKDWSGRDDWYFSLLGDETLADLKVNNQSFTGLTTIILMSPDNKYVDRLLELVKSSDKTVRAAAVRDLITVSEPGPEVVRALVPWLEDPNWAKETGAARQTIVRKLSEYEIPESVPGLIKVLDEREVQTPPSMLANTAANAARPANVSAANTAVIPVFTYPFRYAALDALAKQKDGRAVPALRRILPEGVGYERSMIVKTMLACGGFTIAEQLNALEAGIKRENTEADPNTNAVYNPAAQSGRITQAELDLLLSQQLTGATEISDELARAIVDRIESLDTRDPKLSALYRKTILKWQNAAINILLLRDVKRDMAGPDTIVRLLGQRAELRQKQPTDVSDIRTGSPIAVGTAACLLEDTNDYAAILDSGDAETKTAMLACARLIRAPLTVTKVVEDLDSPNKLLALAAERYLESEDSVEARHAVLARHPGEARLMGAMTAFEPEGEVTGGTEYLWLLYQSLGDNSLYYGWGGSGNDLEIKAAEKRLQDEVKKDADLLGIYAYDGNYVRIYNDRVMFSWDEDNSRYRERPLTKEEFDEIKAYIASNKADELPPFVGCGGGYCIAKELVMLGRNGGRRVYVNGGDYVGGGSYPFFEGLEEYFKRLKQTRATLKYGLSREIPGLEILLASDDLHASTVWKDGNELKIAASDNAVRKRVKAEIDNSDPDGDVANEEGVSDENEQKKVELTDKRRFEGYGWYKVAEGEASNSTQPTGVEFIPLQDGLGVQADEQQWKARLPGTEIRTSEAGIFKVVGGRLIKIRDGNYNSAIAIPGGRWVMASKSDENGVETCVRINLLNNREYPVPIEGYGQRYPAAYIPTLNRVLIVRDDSYDGEEGYVETPEGEEDITPEDDDPSGMLLVDAATGATQPIAGEFRPISQQTFRPLQRTGRINEYWAAIPDSEKNMTEVGIYDINHFGFRAVLTIPKMRFNSMDMYVDEPGGKVYFIYRGHLLALPLPK
jgi:HEAT repeat protein